MEFGPKQQLTLQKMHYYYITPQLISIFEMMDKFASANSIEPRHPMMDKRLVEFCYAVPTTLNMTMDGIGCCRHGLDLLPNEVQWRKGKRNFSMCLREICYYLNGNIWII